MKFKFIGKTSELYGINENNSYEILQFGIKNNCFIIYIINEERKLNIISYPSVNKFNENWLYTE